MGTNNGNGTETQRAKLEPALNQEVRVKLLKDKPYTGENTRGKYFLYSIVDLASGEEKAFFAPDYIHDVIVEKHLGKDSEFILKKVPFQNGNKISSKLEISLVNVASAAPIPQAHADNLKETMRQCLTEAIDIVRSLPDIPFQNDDIRAICASLFIARTKLGNSFH
jgi:hypothetical protein